MPGFAGRDLICLKYDTIEVNWHLGIYCETSCGPGSYEILNNRSVVEFQILWRVKRCPPISFLSFHSNCKVLFHIPIMSPKNISKVSEKTTEVQSFGLSDEQYYYAIPILRSLMTTKAEVMIGAEISSGSYGLVHQAYKNGSTTRMVAKIPIKDHRQEKERCVASFFIGHSNCVQLTGWFDFGTFNVLLFSKFYSLIIIINFNLRRARSQVLRGLRRSLDRGGGRLVLSGGFSGLSSRPCTGLSPYGREARQRAPWL